MTSFDTLQSISSRLTELTGQLSTSKLSKEELAEFETLSRKLYERAVILNYKAKEESVYGKTSNKKVNPVLPFSNESDEVDGEEEEISIAENYIEAIVEEHNSVTEEEIEEEHDGELEDSFEEDEEEEIVPEKEISTEEGEVQFDFSGGFDTPQVEEKPLPQTERIQQRAEEPKKIEEPIREEPKIEPEIKKDVVQESIAQKVETTVVQSPKASLDEMLKESDKAEDKTASFYERFSKAYKAAAGDRLGTSKINSLIGAIGLNDRMLFINELFNGDSSNFNETIEKLDQLENEEVALRLLSEIAAQENWNKEDSSVDEFAHLITRRYVN